MMLFIIGIIAIVGGIIAAFVTIGNKMLNSKQRMSTIAIAVVVCILGIGGVASDCITTIPTGHTGIVTTFGRVENYT